MVRKFLLLTGLAVVILLNSHARAGDDDLADLVQQLNADKFGDRQAASRQLADMGPAAFPALIEAAESDVREISTRAVAILEQHLNNGDDATKAAAQEALEQVAKSTNPAAARRAKDALEPPEEEDDQQQPFRIFPGGGGIQIGGGQIQVQIQAGGAGGARRIQFKAVNGVKEINVEENGRKIKIHDDPNQGIKMEVTEKKDGKEETKKYEAKDADELKKKHPEAHEIYKKYTGGVGGIQIQAAPIQLPRIQIQPPQLPQPNNAENPFERSKQQIDQLIERFKQQIENNEANAEHFKRTLENLERHKQRLDEQAKQFDERKERVEESREAIEPENGDGTE